MKKQGSQSLVVVAAVAVMLILASSAAAQSGEALYKAKCVACHAADGSGSATGKKLGARDFHSPEVQNMSDAELTEITANGKNKMPGYAKSLKPDEIASLVAYIRTLAPAK